MDCTTFTIDGQQACGYVVTGNSNSTAGIPTYAIMQLGSYINGNMYIFTMTGNQYTFNSTMPTVQAMLESFRTPAQ